MRVAQKGHQPHVLQSVHMCTESICGWSWHVPLVLKLFSTQTPSGITREVICDFLVVCIPTSFVTCQFSSLAFLVIYHILVLVKFVKKFLDKFCMHPCKYFFEPLNHWEGGGLILSCYFIPMPKNLVIIWEIVTYKISNCSCHIY